MQRVKGGTIAEAGCWVIQPIFRGTTLSPHYPLIMNSDSSAHQRKIQRERKTRSDWKIKVRMQDMNGFMGYVRADFDLQKLLVMSLLCIIQKYKTSLNSRGSTEVWIIFYENYFRASFWNIQHLFKKRFFFSVPLIYLGPKLSWLSWGPTHYIVSNTKAKELAKHSDTNFMVLCPLAYGI